MNNINIEDKLSQISSDIAKQCHNEYKRGFNLGRTAFVLEMKKWATNRVKIDKEDVLDYLRGLAGSFNNDELRYKELLKHFE